MKKSIFITILFLSFNLALSQNKFEGVILDKDTKKPLEFVDIYNNKDYVSTNEEGKFVFYSSLDSINFRLLGYKNLKTVFSKLPKNDTIFLENTPYQLDEIIVGKNQKFKEMIRSLAKLFPSDPYEEKFFLRCVLKKNNTIVKMEDIAGTVKRQTLFSTSKKAISKKNYDVEIQNIRKAGILEKDIDFELFSLEKLFNSFVALYMKPEIYDFEEISSENLSLTKLTFKPKSLEVTRTTGYYVINNKDNAFNEVYLINKPSNPKFTESRRIRYRTTLYEVKIKFSKDDLKEKYHIDKAKLNATVEVFDKQNNKILYDVSYILKVSESFKQHDTNSNTSVRKDIFKLKGKYDSNYWKNQNYFKLTDEMNNFIKKLKNDKSNDYKSVINIK